MRSTDIVLSCHRLRQRELSLVNANSLANNSTARASLHNVSTTESSATLIAFTSNNTGLVRWDLPDGQLARSQLEDYCVKCYLLTVFNGFKTHDAFSRLARSLLHDPVDFNLFEPISILLHRVFERLEAHR
jgi:hypothetical protein